MPQRLKSLSEVSICKVLSVVSDTKMGLFKETFGRGSSGVWTQRLVLSHLLGRGSNPGTLHQQCCYIKVYYYLFIRLFLHQAFAFSLSLFLSLSLSAGEWPCNLTPVRQVLHHLSHTPSPFLHLAILQLGSHVFSWTYPKPWSSYLVLLHNWDYRHMPPIDLYIISETGSP
jgi:hypothetical protein